MNHAPTYIKVLTAVAASLLVAGCYTQTGTVREDSDAPDYGSADSRPGYDTSAVDSGAYNDDTYESARRHFYYDYYYPYAYPPVSVGFGFYDAWWYGYYPWYTSVYWTWPYYGWGFYAGYYPYYGWGYYGGYYPYYDHHYPVYGAPYARVRTSGVTRGGGYTRGGPATYGGRLAPSATAGTRTGSRAAGRDAVTQGSAGRTGARPGRVTPGYRGQASRRESGYMRGGTRTSPPSSRLATPPSRSWRGGERPSGGRSYSPAPSPGSRGGSSGPSGGRAPSSGGHPSSGGSRGGSRR